VASCILVLFALAACNSTDPTLGVEGASGSPATAAALPPVPAAAPKPATPTPATTPLTATPKPAAAAATIRMRWAPIIGAPVDKVTPLSRRISARAREQNIAILASTDQTATHVLKGYFSVLGEGSNSTVIYVFDILDPAGNRLHRIQGQETITGSNAADPWAAVPASTLESIADKTMADFAAWQRSTQI
jgi:hypothetical protein